jgi:hypothetical protein
MCGRILRRMRQKIRDLDYVMTLHAEQEMADDDLTILDVERAVLEGAIRERQRDHQYRSWKYVIAGPTMGGETAEVVARLSVSGKLVIVTVYRA